LLVSLSAVRYPAEAADLRPIVGVVTRDVPLAVAPGPDVTIFKMVSATVLLEWLPNWAAKLNADAKTILTCWRAPPATKSISESINVLIMCSLSLICHSDHRRMTEHESIRFPCGIIKTERFEKAPVLLKGDRQRPPTRHVDKPDPLADCRRAGRSRESCWAVWS
jgi:hypothetical protein